MEDDIKSAASAMGKKGAKARWAKTTPEERKAYSQMLLKAKRAKRESTQD